LLKITVFRLRRMAAMRSAIYAGRIPAVRARQRVRLANDLRVLHDVLARTELSGRYWVWSGLLLGWARERDILAHDCLDADFAVADEDFGCLVSAVPAIVKAGFAQDRCFINNAGEVTQLTFMRNGAVFDFFRMFRRDEERLTYYSFAFRFSGILELEKSILAQERVPFDFLDRTWLKHRDHERELTSMYGAWEIPDPGWSYLNGRDLVERRKSGHRHFDWRASPPSLADPQAVQRAEQVVAPE
jgi:hypothetical protein